MKNAGLTFGSSPAVNMITFMAGLARVISRHASSEWMFGRFTSSTITSGWSRCADSSSALPSATLPTISQSSASNRLTAFTMSG